MRELQLWAADEGLEEAFEDVTALFASAVSPTAPTTRSRAARCVPRSRTGSLPAERWESYQKLAARARASRAASRQAGPVRGAPPLAGDLTRGRRADADEGQGRLAGRRAWAAAPLQPVGYGAGAVSTFAAPGVGVVVNAQSVAASSESWPSGICGQRAVDGVRVGDGVAAALRPRRGVRLRRRSGGRDRALVGERVEQRAGRRVDERDAVRSAVLCVLVDDQVGAARERSRQRRAVVLGSSRRR